MTTSSTYREFLSEYGSENWTKSETLRKLVVRQAIREARRLGCPRIEIVDVRRNVVLTIAGKVRTPAPASARMPAFEHDGGRAAAGFKGRASGDCVTRAIAIATGKPYREVYDALNDLAKMERPRGKTKRSSSERGVHRVTYERYLFGLGFKWVPIMKVGSGCTVHLRADELPKTGRLVLSLSRHLAAVVDGALYDVDDCSRGGTRCVYGYYLAPEHMRLKRCPRCAVLPRLEAIQAGCEDCGGCGEVPNDPADLLCTCSTNPAVCPVDEPDREAA
jgi:hypothetical protein